MSTSGVDTAAVKLAGARRPTMQHGTRWMRAIVGCRHHLLGGRGGDLDGHGVVQRARRRLARPAAHLGRRCRSRVGSHAPMPIPKMYALVMAGFAAKELGAGVRYFVAEALYGSVGDANEYDAYGRFLAPSYRHLDFSPETGKLMGTGFLKAVTGILYAIEGSSKLGGFVVFSFLGFLGLLLLWRAFKLAVPHGDHYRYALLVLFLPSLLYWPSALGQGRVDDASGSGLISYGVARFLNRSVVVGALCFVPGLVGITLVRPHVSLVVFAGLLLAALLAKPKRPTPASPLIRVATFGVLWVMLLILLSQTSAFLGVDSLRPGDGELAAHGGGGSYRRSQLHVHAGPDGQSGHRAVRDRDGAVPAVPVGGPQRSELPHHCGGCLPDRADRPGVATPALDLQVRADRGVHRVRHRHHLRVLLRVLVVLKLRDPRPAAMSGHAVLPRADLHAALQATRPVARGDARRSRGSARRPVRQPRSYEDPYAIMPAGVDPYAEAEGSRDDSAGPDGGAGGRPTGHG